MPGVLSEVLSPVSKEVLCSVSGRIFSFSRQVRAQSFTADLYSAEVLTDIVFSPPLILDQGERNIPQAAFAFNGIVQPHQRTGAALHKHVCGGIQALRGIVGFVGRIDGWVRKISL